MISPTDSSATGGHRGRRALVAAVALALTVVGAGCGITPVPNGQPIPPAQLGPVVPGVDGGLPIECRGVPVLQCREMGAGGGQGVPGAIRMVVTCVAVCTPQEGEVRMDIVLADGQTQPLGGGGYSTGEAVPAPIAVPEPTGSTVP